MVQDTNDEPMQSEPSMKYGQFLAHPPPGEEIAISGMSGQFPLSSNIEEFKNNLYDKVDMVSHHPQVVHPEVPPGLGKLKDGDLSKFDAGFFGVHKIQARTMNPMCKLLLEKCVECIFDAGLHPSDLEGTNTGVFMGICFSESEWYWYLDEHVKNGNAISGNLKGMIANQISYFLKLNAPSFNCDTACSSTMYALEAAYRAIRKGDIQQAIVCGSNTLLAAGSTIQFARLGVLSKEGILRAFDQDGLGYVRAEAVSAMLIQKTKHCNRIYAKIIHMKTNCDGYKEEGITYPSGKAQISLLKEIYMESGINPKDVSFIEAHGTGTPVGDPEELNCIDEFFAKGRPTPLLIGSVKSSIGHTEPVSGLCSIVKAVLAFETNLIPPNINFKSPRKTIPGLCEGRMKVVVEETPFQDQNGLIGVSSFGFGGGNAHVLLKWNTKKKIGNGEPRDDLPRLVCVSGRTEEAVKCLLDDIATKWDAEHIGLIHNSYRKPVKNHLFRGYTIVSRQGVLKQSVQPFNPNRSKLHIYFGGLTRSSGSLAQELLKLNLFTNLKKRLQNFLTKKHLDLNAILSKSITSILDHLLSEVITQLCLAELLVQLEIEFQGASADFFGEFTCGYFENSLMLEEVLECIYAVGKIVTGVEGSKNGNNNNIAETFTQYKSQILKEFEKILKCPKQYNGYNGTEVKTTTPEHFVEAIFQNSQSGGDCVLKNSVILEIGHSLNVVRKRRFKVLSFNVDGGFQGVLEVLGSLYEYGLNPQVRKLYPEVQFPVSRSTPMISSKIKWKHDYEYFTPTFDYRKLQNEAVSFSISLKQEQWADLGGHIVDGRNLFPATGYLFLVWSVMGEVLGIDINQLKVVFENCKFKKACTLPNKSTDVMLTLCVMIQRASGKFEVSEEDVPVVTGRIRVADGLPGPDWPDQSGDPIANNDMLSNKDIYKELRLRGYNYKGLFRSLTQCNKSATSAKIRWAANWIAFMDNMLQLKILAEDTRLLYVPIAIARLTINPNAHLLIVDSLKSGDGAGMLEIPVQFSCATGIIRSGGIEIRGLLASSIPRKRTTAFPVLETYQFVPNEAKLGLEQSARVFMQIALENNCGFKVSIAELIDEASNPKVPLLGSIIQDVLGDQPLVHSDIAEFNSENLYTVVVGSKLLTRQESLHEAIRATVETGYIISREPLSTNSAPPSNLITLCISETDQEKLVFLKKQPVSGTLKPKVYINVSTKDKTFDWLKKLKDAVGKDCEVIACCQNEPLNGVIGLVNCIRREPGCKDVRSLFIVDEAPDFDASHSFYKKQLDKNMAVNIFINGQWGTYRHLLLDHLQEVDSQHCYANSTVRGDLSSIKWMEGPLSENEQLRPNESLIEVYYSSLNFRDVMTASGRINVDVITRDRREQECVQGFEFSGKTKSGKRVMGIVPQGALATLVKADNNLLWEVPRNWSLKDAATVPVVYGTCLYGLVVVGKIKPSDSILIHSGTGGIGQAAINLCLNMGCTVFITVGTDEKRKFILRNFPKIKARHIGNSRDLSFEQIIMKETNGKGVDIVLNSLAEEKLSASVRCLAAEGRFLEIGKFDIANDNQLNLMPFRKGANFHGVMLDKLFNESSSVKEELRSLVQEYIDSEAIKPLMATTFEINEVEQAFRYMTAGKHMGKVLVEVRREDESKYDQIVHFKGCPRYFCNPEKSYIICGGLGGFGLELADWLVLRGARNLILTSRKGITTGYQGYRISTWEKYCCKVKISTQDITSKSGCAELIKEANGLAPVDAIFNLAVVLEDAVLENQSEKSFEVSFKPKAYATEHLDEVTRNMCPELRDFVVFSSVSCGRGNAGQSNYGMSNSVMERICERRRNEGYPALAIQWGAIGDVGLVAELQEDHIELEIGGTLQQSISNCLQVMDVLLRQREAAVVSSIVVAEKRATSASGNIEEVIGGILGIRDLKSISRQSTLAELGMDSMTAIEVKQTLEREYNIFLSPAEMRSITLARIQEMQQQSSTEETSTEQPQEDVFNFSEILKNNDPEIVDLPLSKLKSKSIDNYDTTLPKVICLPGVEGYCNVLQRLTQNLTVDAYGLNFCPSVQMDTFPEMADILLPYVQNLIEPRKSFNLVAHSMGTLVALELASKLETQGYLGTVTLLDGSPSFMRKLVYENMVPDGDPGDSALENSFIAILIRTAFSSTELENIMKDICKCSTLQEKLKVLIAKVNPDEHFLEETLFNSAIAVLKRSKASLTYSPTFKKLHSKIRLFKPTISSVKMDSEDYELSQLCLHPVEIKVFEGTHTSFLENKEMTAAIMEYLSVVNGFAEE